MTDIRIYKEKHAGRITLNRPKALNALTYQMCLDIEAALDAWREDDEVLVVVIDAEGDKAFCAGGDIQELYDTGRAGNFDYGRTFWADEYRMNAKIAAYSKPTVAFMQGFVMGGGVGVAGHCSHRIVCETSQVSMPEVGIGLVPDVGGTHLLSQAPGRCGEYLGLTAARMNAADAIFAGFADYFVPREYWLDLTTVLEMTGDVSRIVDTAGTAEDGTLAVLQPQIDAVFAGDLPSVIAALDADETEFAQDTLKILRRNSPLAMSVALANLARARTAKDVRATLGFEYEYTYRSMEHGDFLEGIRAAIIDKDRNPAWKHSLGAVPEAEIARMTAPLGDAALKL